VSFLVMAVLAALGFAAIAVLVGLILFFTGRRRPEPGLGVAGSPGVYPGSYVPTAPAAGTWNAEILGDGVIGALGGTVSSQFGTVHVENSSMTFTPEGGASWSLPCSNLLIGKRGFLAIDGSDVIIESPRGPLRMNVSREHINRVMENDFKDFRERGYADEFLWVLQANGARTSGW
jgi:hypothetical protein